MWSDQKYWSLGHAFWKGAVHNINQIRPVAHLEVICLLESRFIYRQGEQNHHSSKEHLNVSKTEKFGWQIL